MDEILADMLNSKKKEQFFLQSFVAYEKYFFFEGREIQAFQNRHDQLKWSCVVVHFLRTESSVFPTRGCGHRNNVQEFISECVAATTQYTVFWSIRTFHGIFGTIHQNV